LYEVGCVCLKEKLKDRHLILGIFLVMFICVLIFRLADLQIVHGEKYYEDSQRRVLKESLVSAPRGKIYDRNGVPLATNRQGFKVLIVKTGIDNDELNEMLLKLVEVFERNGQSYKDSLDRYLTFDPIGFNGRDIKDILNWQKNPNRLNMNEKDIKETPEELFKYLRDEKFAIDKSYTDEQAYDIMKLRYEILLNNWNFITGGTVELATDVGIQVISEIEERHKEFPGLITDVEAVREYQDTTDYAHILGYVRPITSEQLNVLQDEGYDSSDIIGQTGVEKSAEKFLRGKDGKRIIEIDISGRLTLQQESQEAEPGHDVILTIDTKLQSVAMESLERNIKDIRTRGGNKNKGDANAGSVVAIDVHTGEVLVLANYPSYNSAVYLANSSDKEAQRTLIEINNDINKPLFNRAIMGTYAPGSVFKPLTAIAALETGAITPTNNRRYDSGRITIGNRILRCLEFSNGHGWLDLKKALETSCNIYFYEIGYETGIDNLEHWAKLFGLGRRSGIDLPGENAGYMSSKELKKKLRNDIWRPADTAQVAIGQFDNAFTPLQLANYMSALANEGKLYTPHIIKKVVKYDGTVVHETEPTYEEIPVSPETISAVKQGMVAVTQSIDGTAQEAFIGFPYEVAGKTGTAQTGREATHSSNALFLCYAPADDPKIAIAVIVERGVWGSYTAPIARDILDAYFGFDNPQVTEELVLPEGPVFIE
jgi:penicillin-binding protein 2